MHLPFALLSTLPTPVRSLADGTSGTLGEGVVGAHEIRSGAITLDRIADLPAGVLLGRHADNGGPPHALWPATVRALLDGTLKILDVADVNEAQSLNPSSSVIVLRTQGRETPGDGGAARFVRSPTYPGHAAAFQTVGGQWWDLAEPYVLPQMFGPAADGSGDDSAWLEAAVEWQRTRNLAVLLSGEYRLAGRVVLPGRATLEGLGSRQARLLLTSGFARLEIGGGPSAIGAERVGLDNFEIDGGDVANYGLVLSEEKRPDGTTLGWSVYTGGGRYRNLHVTACRKVGLHVGADSDDSQFALVASYAHRADGTEADAVRIESPAHFTQCLFGGSSGYAVRADRSASGSQTPETLYTVDSSRINFSRKGLVYHNGTSDSGGGGGIGVFDKCFFENVGFAGSFLPEKEPVVESTLEPSAIHCERGRVSIINPKKLHSGWGRSLVKASNRGTIDLALNGCEVAGNTVPGTRKCTMFVAGLENDHRSRITIHGQVEIKDIGEFHEVARVGPSSYGWPIESRGGDLGWEANLSKPGEWSAPAASVGTTTFAGRVMGQGVALEVTGNGAGGNNRIETTLRLPQANKRLILLQVAGYARETGSQNRLGFACRLEGDGLVSTTEPADEIVWGSNVGGADNGYGRWVYHCAMAYVNNGDRDIRVQIYSGRGGSASSDTVSVGQARIFIL